MVLYAPNGSVARSIRSRPEPNAETEQKVREQLQSIDSLLDIRWFPYAIFNEKERDFEGRYALVCIWPQGDPRWQMYQSGEMEDSVDMLGWFCEDIHDAHSVPVAPDSIERKVIELLGRCDSNRIPHSTRMKQMAEKNAALRKKRRAEVADKAGQIARDLHYISGHVEDVTLQRIMKQVAEEAKHND